MLQRPLASSIRGLASAPAIAPCALCSCSCGRKFRQHDISPQQRRFIEPRPDRQDPYANTIELKRLKKELKYLKERRYYDHLKWLHQNGHLQAGVDNILDFMNGFADLARSKRRDRKLNSDLGIEPKDFVQLREDCEISSDYDIVVVGNMLGRDDDAENRVLGKKMVFTLGHTGKKAGVFIIMRDNLIEAKKDPKALKGPAMTIIREQLRLMATTGVGGPEEVTFQAKVLEGRALYALGDINGAIEWWTQAIPGALKNAEMDRPEERSQRDNALLETEFAPWIELGSACLVNGDYEKARWAIDIGCQQDDPTSHYSAALLEQKTNEYGEHVATSSWLYYMTKSAASGHIGAAHALGKWYATSGWKYIEDEPPDKVKPTPFDSYPANDKSKKKDSHLLERISVALGIAPRPPQDVHTGVFHTAAEPSTPYGRLQMAMHWLEVSMGMMYAPSYLLAARLLLEKTLWPLAAAPQEALDLSSRRYDYNSRADYEAGHRNTNNLTDNRSEDEEIPNPLYNPERAKDLLRNVLYAGRAFKSVHIVLDNRAKLRKQGRNTARNQERFDTAFDEENLPEDWSSEIKKWFRYPETREMYMDERRKVIWDDELGVDIEVEAKRICDEWEWDLFDGEGGLLYRHNPDRLLKKDNTKQISARR